MWAARRTLLGLGLAFLLAAGAKHVLLDSGSVPPLSTYALDLARVRSMALGGVLPLRINAEVVAKSRVPSVALLAGGNMFGRSEMVRTAYQVVYPDAKSVVIDSGLDRAAHEAHTGGPFYADRYAAVQRAMLFADQIVVTHVHPDHIGGIASSPNIAQLLERVVLTREQLDNRRELERAHFAEAHLRALKPLEYKQYHRLAPGIVLIKAPGHTPGSQMVFVKLAAGEEYLFVGDVAWHMDNIRLPRARPLAVSRFVIGEDRAAVSQQLRALHELSRLPLHLVVSHDGTQLAEQRKAGLVGAAFE